MSEIDEFGWPVRLLDGERVCARPGCTSGTFATPEGACVRPSVEFRIDGYCSIECRESHEYEREIEGLRAVLNGVRSYLDGEDWAVGVGTLEGLADYEEIPVILNVRTIRAVRAACALEAR